MPQQFRRCGRRSLPGEFRQGARDNPRVLCSTLYIFKLVTGGLQEPDQLGTWHYTKIGVRSQCLKSQSAPEMPTHGSQDITEGRLRLGIPSSLLNRNGAIRMQGVPQQHNQTV